MPTYAYAGNNGMNTPSLKIIFFLIAQEPDILLMRRVLSFLMLLFITSKVFSHTAKTVFLLEVLP
jgi:hypothetical protein